MCWQAPLLLALQAWGVLEHSEGNLKGAREMFQQGVWAQPKGRDVGTVWQVRPHTNMPGQSMPRLSHCPVITT